MYDPFENITRLHDEMESLFNRLFRDTSTNLLDYTEGKKELIPPSLQAGVRTPMIDLRETESSVISRINLPGIDKKDIQLSIDNNMLEIKVEKKNEKNIQKGNEFSYSSSLQSFYRKIELPTQVKADDAKARYVNGVLDIEIPKLEALQDKRKNIDIE